MVYDEAPHVFRLKLSIHHSTKLRKRYFCIFLHHDEEPEQLAGSSFTSTFYGNYCQSAGRKQGNRESVILDTISSWFWYSRSSPVQKCFVQGIHPSKSENRTNFREIIKKGAFWDFHFDWAKEEKPFINTVVVFYSWYIFYKLFVAMKRI